MPASRSSPSSADVASAAGGNARTTTMAPAGSTPSLGARRWRNRRLTRWRTTDPPTALLTTSPARGAPSAVGQWRWITSLDRPLRRPRRRTATNSSRRVSRDPAGSTGPAGSGGEPLAALATTGRDDGAARAGTHAQPEAVRAGPAAVVGLEGALALAHGRLSWSTAMPEQAVADHSCGWFGQWCSAPARPGHHPRRTTTHTMAALDPLCTGTVALQGTWHAGRRRPAGEARREQGTSDRPPEEHGPIARRRRLVARVRRC